MTGNRLLLLFLFIGLPMAVIASPETGPADSLLNIILKSPRDTNTVNRLLELSKLLLNDTPEISIKHAEEAAELSADLNYGRGLAQSEKSIGLAYYMQGDYIQTLTHWNRSKDIFDSIGDLRGSANLLSNLGAVYFNQGDDATALEYYLKSLKIAERIGDTLRILTNYQNIGAVHLNKRITHDQALSYFLKALPLTETLNDKDATGTVTVNIGEIYLERGNIDTALYYFERSRRAFEQSENLPYTLFSIGKAYMMKKDFGRAMTFQRSAYEYAKKLDSKNDMAISLIGLGKVQIENGDYSDALNSFVEAENISNEIGASYQLKDAYEGLTRAYSKMGNYSKAFEYQNALLAIKDTLFNLDIQKKLGTLQFTFDIEKKESQINLLTKDQEIKAQEIRRQKLVRNGFIGGFAVVLLFAGVFLSQRNRISKEKKRSEELLLNILPEETAEELKATGQAKAKSFESVSVMFTDFKNFTQASELLSAEQLVEEINRCYSAFDTIITRYGLEKIKTIGDSYMCAGGLPAVNDHHATDIVAAALELQAFIEENKRLRISENLPYFELRLGIHTGPVVAGVVGSKKFAYDIWGDTVNTASRMESSGAVGRVNVSASTHELIKHRFRCTPRGKIEAKNKGEIEMFFVEGPTA
ncbi:MAG: adenylate/guanylate cyclase domain-containing protein [Bacteroidota bacterium]